MCFLAERLEGSVRNTEYHVAGIIIAPDAIDKSGIVLPKRLNCWSRNSKVHWSKKPGCWKWIFWALHFCPSSMIPQTDQRVADEDLDSRYYPLRWSIDFWFVSERRDGLDIPVRVGWDAKVSEGTKPENVEDLITMNALYRPGPMDNIPSRHQTKNGCWKGWIPSW